MKDLIWKIPVMMLMTAMVMVSCSESASDIIPLADVDHEEILDLRTDGVEAGFDELDAEFLAYDNGFRGPCFTLVFPVTLVYPDSTQEEAASLEELKEWGVLGVRLPGEMETVSDVPLSNAWICWLISQKGKTCQGVGVSRIQ